MKRSRFVVVLTLGAVITMSALPAFAAKGPGSLLQTTVEPSFGAPFTKQMKLLASAFPHHSVAIGNKVFFPEAAYVSMKTGEIPNPAGDWQSRLFNFFVLDLGAYRNRLFSTSDTTFARVEANPRYAQWIPPGVCENKIGYWHEPNVRLVFRHNTTLVSVLVASLISWRGVWYVVHLGPNPRGDNVGTVDGYQLGAGVPGPGGGC
jgi:hypothetical protein